MLKPSPIAKIYEAYSALADGRVLKAGENVYHIASSDRAKTYTVRKDGKIYSSNDNATLWQHYAGYPILAVWMTEGILPYDASLLSYFRGIPWKKLNTENKNDYAKAIQEAFKDQNPEVIDKISSACEELLKKASALDFEVKGNREKLLPPSL